LEYEKIPKMSRAEIDDAVARDQYPAVSQAVISAALFSDDLEWAQELCLRLALHQEVLVRGSAILGLGHLARIHGHLDRARVEPVVAIALQGSDSYLRAQADDTADDLQAYLGWHIQRPITSQESS
jgi:hypothetical protein